MSSVFDLEGVMQRVDDDTELFAELVEIFFEDYDPSIEAIQKAIASNSAGELETSAHAIKSALGNLGAMTSFDLAFKLEKLGRSGSTEGAAEIFEELKQEIAKYHEAVKLWSAK